MTQVRVTQHYEAPVEHVFELGIDPKRIPEYMSIVYQVTDVTEPFDQVGASYTTQMKVLGRPIGGRVELTAVERPHSFTRVGISPLGGKFTWNMRLTPAGVSTDAEVVVDYELPAGFFGELFDKLFAERAIARDLKYSIECFKALVEAKVPAAV